MTDSWRAAAERLTADLRGVFGARLLSVVAYGPTIEGRSDSPLTCLALVSSLDPTDLDACAHRVPAWRQARIATPLLLPAEEFRRSLDAFPLEYGEIIRAHARVFGDDPFDGLTIAADDVRRACETQIKSHLLHLREAYVETAGRPAAIAELVTDSAPAFGALLRHVARLTATTASGRVEASLAGARAAGLPEHVVESLLALEEQRGLATSDPARLFPDYLAAVEQLAHAVDSWRQN